MSSAAPSISAPRTSMEEARFSNQPQGHNTASASEQGQMNAAPSRPAQKVDPSLQQRQPIQGNVIPARQNSQSSSYVETNLHLQNYTLLAEAAERAQMDCTMRDMDELSL